MIDCIFCKIAANEIPAEVVYEDESVIAFLDIHPVNFGHTLLIPKRHVPTMLDVPDEMLNVLFVAAKKLMGAIKKGCEADYVALTVVGVDVPHFHIHLIPRYLNDGLAGFWPTKTYRENEAEVAGENIRKEL